MGWTHHWQRQTELPPAAFAVAVQDIKRLLPQLGVPLAGFEGTGDPMLRDDAVVFNGANGASCEPFEIHQMEFDRHGRQVVWSFCKTEHLPYDLCVQAALVVLKHHLGQAITVGSDGEDRDWLAARQACQGVLGYGEEFQLAKDATWQTDGPK